TPEPTPAVTLTPTAASSPASGQTVETAVPPASADEGGAALALAEIDPDTIATEETAPPPDPVGFLLAWLVVIALAVVMVFAVWRVVGSWPQLTRAEVVLVNSPGRTMLFWALIGLGLIVSGYLAYVETMHVMAVCGPVGECNLVQSSPYARILSIPVAVLGLLFYLALAALWLLRRASALRGPVIWGLAALTLFGTLFSIYLTLVELLLIHAVCAWCLTSAVVTGLLCVLVMTGVVKRPLSPEPQWQPTD
ncbi:MAG: vitamin K epoxide reductase family protein, partial [Chloroflexota bacterium]